MKIQAPNLNALWCEVLMEELYRLGVRYIGVAPGSRSTPLALAAAAHPDLDVVVHLDERALAFHALGWGRATGRPAVVITTSGTAAANLAPAVAEASLDHVPLLVLTADRPPELRDTAANQTMDQVKLFGSYVRWQFDLPCPSPDVPLPMLLSTLDQAVARTQFTNPGPVHLNCMFREPLAPIAVAYPRRRWLQPLRVWLKSKQPLTTYSSVALASKGPMQGPLKGQRGVVVAGALSPEEARAVVSCARKLGWPVLPDIQSGLRLGVAEDVVISNADLLLADAAWARNYQPDAVLLVGGRLTSKRLAALAQSDGSIPVVRITPWLERQDPSHSLTQHWVGPINEFVDSLRPPAEINSDWLTAWQKADRKAGDELQRCMKKAKGLNEPFVAWELTRLLPANHALFAGNSLPIRLLDTFSARSGTQAPVVANRGVSGIDGLLSTATGYAAGRKAPVTLLIGDLSLLHDLNALALLRSSKTPVVAVVINNDGGGIFSFLPVAGNTRAFEQVFGLPHGRTFAGAAAMFDLPYVRVRTPRAFTQAYRKACQSRRSCLLEVTTDRTTTLRVWRALQQAVGQVLPKA